MTMIKKTPEKKLALFELVGFRVGDEEFAVDIKDIQEIIRVMETTTIPNAPDFVEGVITLRGKIIPIIDLRKRFNIGGTFNAKNAKIIVMLINRKKIGFIVDSVTEVLRITEDKIDDASIVASSVDNKYIRGVGRLSDRLILLLDLRQMFSDEESTYISG